MLWQSGLFEHSICGVARLDLAINNEMYLVTGLCQIS